MTSKGGISGLGISEGLKTALHVYVLRPYVLKAALKEQWVNRAEQRVHTVPYPE